MDYHGRIMNIGASLETIERHLLARPDTAYRIGHRDARHAAAEIACEAQTEIARLREALESIANPPNIVGSYHLKAVKQARAALAPAAEVSGG